jgi:hypothetical protein
MASLSCGIRDGLKPHVELGELLSIRQRAVIFFTPCERPTGVIGGPNGAAARLRVI